MSVMLEKERLRVAKTAVAMLESGLVVNTSGNVSIRVDDKIVITPNGMPYAELEARDIVVLDMQGNMLSGELLPSSETPLHLAVYVSNPGAGAVVHTHSVHATAVSTLVQELPAIHYQIADLGGPVPVAPYQTFGSQALADELSDTICGRNAALMQNHGSVTIGATVEQALARSITLEWLARVYLVASQAGTPTLIDDEELERVLARQNKLSKERERRNAARSS